MAADDFRGAVGEATAAIKDLEAALRAEGCMVSVKTLPDDDEDRYVVLRWAKHGPSKAWRVLATWDDIEKPLLEMPSDVRLYAYPYLGRLGDAARSAMRDAVRRAGLGDAR